MNLEERLQARQLPAATKPNSIFTVGGIGFNSILILMLGNLRTRWMRTLLTMLGIVVGVGAMVAVNATNASTLSAITSFFDEASGQSDLMVEAAIRGDQFDASVLADVARFPEVIVAAPSAVGVTIPAGEAADWSEEYSAGGAAVPGTNFWLLGRDPAIDPQIHTYELRNGRLLEPGESAYTLLLVDEYAEEKGIEVGEDFAILTPTQGVVSLRVVGLIARDGVGILNDGVVGVTPLPVVQELFAGAGQVDQIELVIDDEVATSSESLEDLRERLATRLDSELLVRYPAARGELVTNSIGSYQQGLNFFSVVSLFVGSFLIYNAFAMTVVERTREIGMLRAIGATRRQVLRLVLSEAGLLGLLGSILGVGFGLLLARGLVISVSGFTGQAVEQITATPQSLLTSLLIGMVVTLGAALLPARQAANISPLQALRVQGNSDESHFVSLGLRFGPLTVLASLLLLYFVEFRPEVAYFIGTGAIFVLMLGATLCIPLVAPLLERVLRPLTILVFGSEGQLGSSNVNRAKGRTTLTVAALMVGISMVVGINGLTTSFEADIDRWIETALGGDLFVRSPVNMQPDVETRLLALDGIEAVTRSRFVSTRIITAAGDDEYALFTAVDPESYLDVRGYRIQAGPSEEALMAELAAGDKLVISADAANRLNLAVGDSVLLETRRGQRPFTVAAVVLDFGGGETLNVFGSWGDLRQYFGVRDVSAFAVKLAPGATLETVSAQIEHGVGRGQTLSVESQQEFEDKVRSVTREAFALFDILGLIGLIVAALGVINTMLMNVLERKRELGGLRSLGMTRRQVLRMILAEAATMGVIGAIFGVGFGVLLGDVFLIGLRQLGSFVLTPEMPYRAMIVSFGVAFGVALLAAWYPARYASRINIIEAIKHE